MRVGVTVKLALIPSSPANRRPVDSAVQQEDLPRSSDCSGDVDEPSLRICSVILSYIILEHSILHLCLAGIRLQILNHV